MYTCTRAGIYVAVQNQHVTDHEVQQRVPCHQPPKVHVRIYMYTRVFICIHALGYTSYVPIYMYTRAGKYVAVARQHIADRQVQQRVPCHAGR